MTFSFADLQKWITEWEGPTLEFKLRVNEDAGNTISAFANTFGGTIVFGVESKKKELTGLSNVDEESRRLRQILDSCKPNPKPEITHIKGEGKTFIAVRVEQIAYSQTPCFFKKRCFIRQGTTNLELAGEELIDFLRKRAILNFEESKTSARLHDLDLEKIKRFLKQRKTSYENLNEEETKRILAGLSVANYNGEFFLKNVALLFFAKDPQKLFSNLEARVVRFKGTEAEVGAIILDKRVCGTIPELINGTYKLVSENIGKTFRLIGPERKEILDYPAESLREVITNSFGHRDYFETKEVLIEIFEDRLSITNPGGLLPGQNIANFDKTPRHRNPITYRLLHDLGLGEGLGLGVRLIRRQFRETGLPDPEFYDVGNAFQVVFYNHSSKKPRHAVEFENDRQKQALAYLQKNKSIKSAEFARLAGVSIPTALKDLKELEKQGKIKKIGKYKGAKYELEKPIKT